MIDLSSSGSASTIPLLRRTVPSGGVLQNCADIDTVVVGRGRDKQPSPAGRQPRHGDRQWGLLPHIPNSGGSASNPSDWALRRGSDLPLGFGPFSGLGPNMACAVCPAPSTRSYGGSRARPSSSRAHPRTGSPFLGFAVPTVMGEVRRHFRDHIWPLHVPRRERSSRAKSE